MQQSGNDLRDQLQKGGAWSGHGLPDPMRRARVLLHEDGLLE
jgi:hypothetical protein